MNLLSTTRTPMAEADVIVARAFADIAALSIVQHQAAAEAQRLNEQLSAALTSRVVIEQAKGVICRTRRFDLDEAFSRLRAYARNHNLRLTGLSYHPAQRQRLGSRPDGGTQPAAGVAGYPSWGRLPGEMGLMSLATVPSVSGSEAR